MAWYVPGLGKLRSLPSDIQHTTMTSAAPSLQIKLLGGFKLVAEGAPAGPGIPPRPQSLLAYLALHPELAQSRQHLAFLFWPDATESQARNNLRQTLHQLRKAWPDIDRYLAADAVTVGWRPGVRVACDAAEFERAAAAGDPNSGPDDLAAVRARLQQTLDLYQGDLLPGFYDEWLLAERDRLRQSYQAVLKRLAQVAEDVRDYDAAIPYARRLWQLDPLDEAACATLVRLLALNNDRAGALRAYADCEAALQRDLGVEPGQPLREAYDRLLSAGQLPAEPDARQALVGTLIGRQREWSQLQSDWRRADAGQAGFVIIIGEAGLGKSRLAEELYNWAGQQGIVAARTRAYAAEGRLAYGPIADWLRSNGFWPAVLQLGAIWQAEVSRLLPEILSAQPDVPQPQPLTESWQRQRFFEALARAVLAARQPMLLVFDDLQWSDPETLEWLHFLLRYAAGARLLIVGTVRAEDLVPAHPLSGLLLDLRATGQVNELRLAPLDATETAQLAAQAGDRALSPEASQAVYMETEGNPFFIVELVRSGLLAASRPRSAPAEAPPSAERPLPPRMQAAIAARLAQPTQPARELAGVAAVIGRAFSLRVLSQAAQQPEHALAASVDELWQRRIIREQASGAFDFSHDKLREVAYASIGPARRRLLHQRVAHALETTYAHDLDAVAGQIAAHFDLGQLPDRAIPYYERAALVAQRLYANEEAIGLLRHALALLPALPADDTRARRELGLQVTLGVSLVASRGYGSPSVIETYERAAALCGELGTAPAAPVLRGLAIAHVVRTDFDQARRLGQQLLAQAEQAQDASLTVEANYVLGVTTFWMGDLVTARMHLEQAVGGYDPAHSAAHISLYSQDPKVVCLCRLAFTLWLLGYPDRALQCDDEALATGQAIAHPMSLAYSLAWSAMLHSQRRDAETTRQRAEAAIALGRQHRLGYWLPMAMVLRVWARAMQGDTKAASTEIEQGMATFQSIGGDLTRPYYLALLADVQARQRDIEAGLARLSKALTLTAQNGERWCQPDLYTRQGELLARLERPVGAEAAFERAIAAARAQQARLFELRAVTGLTRLRLSQPEGLPDLAALRAICAWFPPAADFPDLRDALRLLADP
jgi:DNA-binding SARP family transcriptional activator/predicted ATPase